MGKGGDSETSFAALFAAKFFAGGQRDEELLHHKTLRLRTLHDVIGEGGIGEAVGTAEGILDEGFGEAAGEVFALGGDEVAELEVVLEGGAVVELAAGVDGPGFLADAALFEGLLGAPFAGGVEVFEAEADEVDLAMSLQALRLFLMGEEALAGVEQLVFESRDLRHIRRCGRWWVVEEFAQDPGPALDGAGALAVAAHGEDGGHAEQAAAW
jgi:hypothetical protein